MLNLMLSLILNLVLSLIMGLISFDTLSSNFGTRCPVLPKTWLSHSIDFFGYQVPNPAECVQVIKKAEPRSSIAFR